MKQRIWVCKSSRVNKYHQRAPAKGKRKGKEKAPEETLETLKSLRAGCCRGWRPEDLRTRGFKIWGLEASKFDGLRLQNWRLEASNMRIEAWVLKTWGLKLQNLSVEAWGFKIWGLRLQNFQDWGLRLQNLTVEAWGFKIFRIEASNFDGWGFKIWRLRLQTSRIEAWGFKTWRLTQQFNSPNIPTRVGGFNPFGHFAISYNSHFGHFGCFEPKIWVIMSSKHRASFITGVLWHLHAHARRFRLGLVRAWHARPWLMIWSRTDDMILDFGSKKYQKAFTAWNL